MLKRFIKRPTIRHNPPLPWQEIRPFMQALDSWNGFFITRTALQLLALTFVRTVELRRATWDQIDFTGATWSIPAQNMKMRRPHLVPLSKQVVQLLTELHTMTGRLLPRAKPLNTSPNNLAPCQNAECNC
ncbi:tyrosine-type recombinase/integrase [Paenalcaligenes faecalis]|uniref:tyrosine-type recombinase/integrase n=1 Tax=Paenalcaligenes faecalis TaxID=2980099 RepID=UPI003D9C6EAB